MPRRPRAVRRYVGTRKSRPRRPAFAAGGVHAANRLAVRPVPDPARPPEAGRRNVVRRRAADADHRACADDEAEIAHPRRADARLGAGDPRAIVEGPGALAPDHPDHGAAGRAERHLRAAARRPRLCARTRPHRLGRRAGAFRRRNRHRLSVGRRRLATFGCGRFWQLALVFGEIPVAAVIAADLAIAVVVSRPRLSFRAVAHAKSSAFDLRECGDRAKRKTEYDAYQDRSHHGVPPTGNPRPIFYFSGTEYSFLSDNPV